MTTQISKPNIETITAEISVVKIGNKQMTISVFNQLYIEKCWDGNYNILYPIWGKTNREEEYVIFQKGNELRKCCIPLKKRKEEFNRHFYYYLSNRKKLFNFPSIMSDENYNGKYALYHISHCSAYYLVDESKFDLALMALDDELKIEHQNIFERNNLEVEKLNRMIDKLQSVRQLFIAV